MEGYNYELQELKTVEGTKMKIMQPNINPSKYNETNVGLAVRTIKEFYRQRS
jgi:hypothetical protein